MLERMAVLEIEVEVTGGGLDEVVISGVTMLLKQQMGRRQGKEVEEYYGYFTRGSRVKLLLHKRKPLQSNNCLYLSILLFS